MKKITKIKSSKILTEDDFYMLKDVVDSFSFKHSNLTKYVAKAVEKLKKQLEKDSWDIIHARRKIGNTLQKFIDTKSWFKVEVDYKHREKESFYFFPYKLNLNSNDLIFGLYVPINNKRNCGIKDESLHIEDFIYNDSEWSIVNESAVIKYIKNNIQTVIDFRKSKL